MDEEEKDSEVEREEADEVIEDTDADTEDVEKAVEEHTQVDSEVYHRLDALMSAVESVLGVVNSMQQVLLENGARIVDTDPTDTYDDFKPIDELDLTID